MDHPCPVRDRSLAPLLSTGLAALLAAPLAAQAPDALWPGALPGDAFGSVVAVVGDVDADGVDDVAVGAPLADWVVPLIGTQFSDVGSVRVFSGADGALLHGWVGSLGHVDLFGHAVCGAGDVDGDGHHDVLVGAPRADGALLPECGRALLFSGADGSLLRTWDGAQTGERFGHAVAGGGDLNGDFVVDVAIGAPHHDLDDALGGFGQEGRVAVRTAFTGGVIADLYGAPESFTVGGGGLGGPCPDYVMDRIPQHLGWALAFAGDWDNLGGGEELVIAAPLTDWDYTAVPCANWPAPPDEVDAGWVTIHAFGVDAGVVSQVHGSTFSRTGTSLANLGRDTDGDDLLAVGMPGAGSHGLVDLMGALVEGSPGVPVGECVAPAGDVNGDGHPDVLVTSPDADWGSPFSLVDAGIARIHSGEGSAVLLAELHGGTGDHLGEAGAGADLDGDGIPELFLGAPGDGAAGTVWVWWNDTCSPAASLPYGTGLAGTHGVPGLTALTEPVLGDLLSLSLSNSAPGATSAWLLLGVVPLAAPFKQGTLLVDPLLTLGLPLPAGGTVLDLPLAADETLCGVSVFSQLVLADPGAPAGLALSPGLELVLGG